MSGSRPCGAAPEDRCRLGDQGVVARSVGVPAPGLGAAALAALVLLGDAFALEPVIEVARMIRDHLDNVLTYLDYRITTATCEGFNSKIQTIKKLLWLPQSGPPEDGHLLSLRRTGSLPRLKPRKRLVFQALAVGLWTSVQIYVPTQNPEEPTFLGLGETLYTGLTQPLPITAPTVLQTHAKAGFHGPDQNSH